MKTSQNQTKPDSPWQKTRYTNVVRYVPSGVYYARLRVGGKLVWRSLETNTLSTAKLKVLDVQKAEQAKLLRQGQDITFAQALEEFRQRDYRVSLRGAARRKPRERKLKPAAVSYYEQRIKALLASWPGLETSKLSRIEAKDLEAWAARHRDKWAGTSFNHTVSILRQCFELGVQHGGILDNQAMTLERKKESAHQLTLPTAEQFLTFVKAVENSGSGFSRPCAELVQFMAFSGMRKGEAANVRWQDVNLDAGTITVRGDPASGLKNRAPGETRTVPIIPDMQALLEQMREARPDEKPDDFVMRVRECQKAMDRAADEVKMPRLRHHDLRHLFATRCIESGVDIPTVSRWLGHRDGGALAMRVYGHLRDKHSKSMAARVSFTKLEADNVLPMPKEAAGA